MNNQRIITRETPAVWYHKGEVVTCSGVWRGEHLVQSVVGTPWCSDKPMNIDHSDVEWANLTRNSEPYTVPVVKTPTPTKQKRNRK